MEEIAFNQGISEPAKQKEEQCKGLIEIQLAYLRVGKGSAWLEIIRGLGGRRRWGKRASHGEFTWGLMHTVRIGDFILITMGS